MKDYFNLNFECNDLLSDDEDVWLSLQHSYDIKLGYQIHKGDVIKFGSVIFYVNDIGYDSHNTQEALLDLSCLDLVKSQESYDNNPASMYLLLNNSTTKDDSKPSCRICLQDKNTNKDPLISPCNCKGTMQYIHLECLRKMLKMDIIKRSYSVTFFVFTLLNCDLCKKHYSNEVAHGDQVYPLYDFEKPKNNYIILHNSLKSKEIFILIHLKEGKSISIGKTPLVDIPYPDFSISYVQAIISFSKGNYYLADLKSKYGTYIKMPKKFSVFPFHKITVQMNHYFFTFSMKKTFLAYLSCYYPKSIIFKSYNDYFSYLSKQKEQKQSKYCKILSHKKLMIKSILNSSTPSLLLKTGSKCKTIMPKTNNSCFPLSNIING